MKAELVLDCKNQHGEGIFWDLNKSLLWWTDIEGRAIYSFDPITSKSKGYSMKDRVCSFAPRLSSGFIVAFDDRVSFLDLSTNEEIKVCDFEPENTDTRLNDGKTDRQGRFILGGMNEKTGQANSSVISIDSNLNVSTLISGIACANSICFSLSGETMFFSDTPTNEIVAYDYDTFNGTLSNRRLVASFLDEPGLPDGSCVDTDGGVWNAEWEGGRVVRVTLDGQIDQIIEVPVCKPTCCAFGGPNLDTLFITTSKLMSDEETILKEPASGGLFACKPGFKGIGDTPFHG